MNATDSAIKLAEENGIDLSTIKGSGTDGKITKPDVEKVIPKDNDGVLALISELETVPLETKRGKSTLIQILKGLA